MVGTEDETLNVMEWLTRNKDRKIFYLLHTASKPLLYLAGLVFATGGYWLGFIAIIPAWFVDVSADVFYWRNFDRSKARCFNCHGEMVCPNCGGRKLER